MILSLILSKIHTLYLRNKRIIIGKRSLVFHKSHIINKSKGIINIGSGCTIGRSAKGYHSGMPFYTQILNDGKESTITIGSNCRLNGVYIHAKKKIAIGDSCVIASGVSIIDSNGHELYSNDRTIGRDTPNDIKIGNNVWIGINVIILKNTKIGDNCVISAGSVVKGDFPNNSLIVGNPAKVVKILNISNNERN